MSVFHTLKTFYGEVEPERMPMANLLKERWQAWVKCGALCSEMEAAALYVIARTLGIRAGGLMIAHGTDNSLELLCKTAVESVRQLIRLDSN
jgi:uridine phosphorylase